jgi:hypothetical protein
MPVLRRGNASKAFFLKQIRYWLDYLVSLGHGKCPTRHEVRLNIDEQ